MDKIFNLERFNNMNIKKVYFAKVRDVFEGRKYFRIDCVNPHSEGIPLQIPVAKEKTTLTEILDYIDLCEGTVPFIYEVVKGKPFPVLIDIANEVR